MNQEAVSSKNKFRDLKKPASALLEPRVFRVPGRKRWEGPGRPDRRLRVEGTALVPPPGLSVGAPVLPMGGLWAWVGGKEGAALGALGSGLSLASRLCDLHLSAERRLQKSCSGVEVQGGGCAAGRHDVPGAGAPVKAQWTLPAVGCGPG